MFKHKIVTFLLILSLFSTYILAETITKDHLDTLNGNWHLWAMNKKDVRKARAILDFHSGEMLLSGFDGCNRISGHLQSITNTQFSTTLTSTKMACRQSIHRYVRKHLHATIKEGFSINKSTRYGVEGITLKSKSHDLFFQRMGE